MTGNQRQRLTSVIASLSLAIIPQVSAEAQWPAELLSRLAPEVERETLYATTASEDLSVIAGWGQRTATSSVQAFRWSVDGGFRWIESNDPRVRTTSAHGVSPDGVFVVGSAVTTEGAAPFRWSAEGGFELLGEPDPFYQTMGATDASNDGAVVVGATQRFQGHAGFIWKQSTGERVLTGRLDAVSGDGAIAVGSGVWIDGVLSADLAFSPIADVSLDGRFAIWRNSSGEVLLVELDLSGEPSVAAATRIFVGVPFFLSGDAMRAGGKRDGDAVVWTRESGTRDVTSLLADLGGSDNEAQWHLSETVGAAPDGRVVGNGMYEGSGDVWLASLHWSSCRSDLTGDRFVDGRDLLYIISAWNASTSVADLNDDGVVNGADMALALADWGLCR